MAAETQFDVPAITAGTPQARNIRDIAQTGGYPFFYRTELEFVNRGTATAIWILNGLGLPRRVAPGATVIARGQIRYYTVDASASTASTDFTVYERGGLDEYETETQEETRVVSA